MSLVVMMDRTKESALRQLKEQLIFRVNQILRACGVTFQTGSTQIYAEPAKVHVIAAEDLRFLAANATLLVTEDAVVCDFATLSTVLWGMLRELLPKLDHAVGLDDTPRSDAATTKDEDKDSSKDRDAEHRLHEQLYGSFVQAIRVITLLRAFEAPLARPAVRGKVLMVQSNADLCTRLIEQLTTLFLRLAAPATESTLSALRQPYDVQRHRFFRMCEHTLSCLMRLLAMLAARPAIDASGILHLFAAEPQWRASGAGLVILDNYCLALQQVITALYARHREYDKVDETSARLLLRHITRRPPFRWDVFRLLYFSPRQLPLVKSENSACWGMLIVVRRVQRAVEELLMQRTLKTTAEAQSVVRSMRKAVARQLTLFEQQQQTQTQQQQKQTQTQPQTVSGAEDESLVSHSHLLSYYQLLAMAAVRGMPEADLTNDAALLARAQVTALSDEPAVLEPGFLRLLLACAYTVETSDNVESATPHAVLSAESALALYHSLARYVFQEWQFIAGGGGVNGLFALSALQVRSLVRLVLDGVVQSTRHATGGGAPITTETRNEAAVAGSASEAHRSDAGNERGMSQTSNAPANEGTITTTMTSAEQQKQEEQQSTNNAAHALLTLIDTTIEAVYTTNCKLAEQQMTQQRQQQQKALHRLKALAPAANTKDEATTAQMRVDDDFRVVTLLAVDNLFALLQNEDFVTQVDLSRALHDLARLYALRAFHPPPPRASEAERKLVNRLMTHMQYQLAFLPRRMSATTINRLVEEALLPRSTTACVAQSSKLQLNLLEAYLRAFATSSAAFAVTDELMLRSWVDIALPAATNGRSTGLAVAAHDFLIAPFLAHKALSPLFVPTYIALFVPTSKEGAKYGEPTLEVVRHFARLTRAACQGIESCDATALQRLTQATASCTPHSAPLLQSQSQQQHLSPSQVEAVRHMTPVGATLLVVAALFDKLCLLWNESPSATSAGGSGREAQERFVTYFSALVNLLQCTNRDVLQRVCASVEAMEVEHLRGSGSVQLTFLEFIGTIVDNVRGTTKKGVAEWFLKVQERVRKENAPHAKL